MEYKITAYNNKQLFLEFIEKELILTLNPTKESNTTSLLVLNAAIFHTTNTVLARLKDANIVPSLIPARSTGLIQSLDTAINKPFKGYLCDFTNCYIMAEKECSPTLQNSEGWSISNQRIITTH